MKVFFLGTNGWYDTKTGNTSCILIESSKYYIVFDAGNGIYKLDKFIKRKKPTYLFISHFHFDHISGLHILAKFQFSQPIEILGQPGTKKILNKIITSPYSVPFSKLKTKVIVRDLLEGANNPPKLPFLVECKYLVHADPCFGYRFKIPDGITPIVNII